MSRRGCGCGGHHGYYGEPGDGLIMLVIMLCLAVAAMPIVVQQLKAQEDIMTKQDDLSKRVKAHEIQLQEKTRKDNDQDAEIARQVEKGKELDKRIDAGEKKDKDQDAEMA